jgi:moderate conductance mechanosensitive channel
MRQAQEAPELPEGIIEFFRQLPEYAATLISIGVVIGVALLLTLLVRRAVRRLMIRVAGDPRAVATTPEGKRAQTLGQVLRAGALFLIWLVTVLVALSQTGIDIAPVLAAAGIGGLAIGFGAQSLVKDVISGFFVLFEDQYHVGDIIEIVGVVGVVDRISLRTTVLRDLDGRRHVVPNGEIRVSSNHTKEFSRYLFDVPVPYEADVDETVQVVEDAFEELRDDENFGALILGPLTVMGVNAFGDSQVDVRMYIETVPGMQWMIGREFRRRIKLAYDAAGISVPYPHREVIIYQDGKEPVKKVRSPVARGKGEDGKGPAERR